jgi:hypothetical protein
MTMNRLRFTPPSPLHAGVVTALMFLALTAWARPAFAGPIVSSAPDCDEQRLSKPFLPWIDPADYTPQPGGGFEEPLDGWRLADGARVVPGNEPFDVQSRRDGASLLIPSRASVTTSSVCVGLGHPTIRLFARRTGGPPTSVLAVEVLFEDNEGDVHRLPIGGVVGGLDWAPSLPLPIVANLLPLLPEDRTAVAFRFTALRGDWQVDDLFVDPWRAR